MIYIYLINNYIFNGIIWIVIKKIVEDYNILFKEEMFIVDFLRNVDEVIVLSILVEVIFVIKLDGELVNDGKVGLIIC